MKRSCHFKCGFTLVEMLIVVVVIVILMSITFKLTSVGEDSRNRNITINRMQRLENCLSGYYAAYGSYPPVALHGSRDYTLAVDDFGIQRLDDQSNTTVSENSWKSVEAACRAQPIGMEFPFTKTSLRSYVDNLSNLFRERANSSDSRYSAYRNRKSTIGNGFFAATDASDMNSEKDGDDDAAPSENNWSHYQVYKFGLMSYLLPRLMLITGAGESASGGTGGSGIQNLFGTSGGSDVHPQLADNNTLPSTFDSGVPFRSWRSFYDQARSTPWKIAVLPSQSCCARWIQNLQGQLVMTYDRTFYGVSLKEDESTLSVHSLTVHSKGDSQQSSGSQPYVLDCITMQDGWDNEFYYYSLPPHQSYTVWSAGANGRTFPPWISEEARAQLPGTSSQVVQKWVADDVMYMSN